MDLEQHNFLIDVFGAYDPTFIPVWGAHYSDYSSCSWCVILEKDNGYYIQEYYYSPEAGGMNEVEWNPYQVTEEQAIEEMLRWDKI